MSMLEKDIVERAMSATVFITSIVKSKVTVPEPDSNDQPTAPILEASVELRLCGSGFIVDPEGYIITNGHVVFSVTSQNIEQDRYVFSRSMDKASEKLKLSRNYCLNYGRLVFPEREINVQFGDAILGVNVPREKTISARLVGNPSPAYEKDLAIINVDKKDLVYLELNTKTPKILDRVYVFGYPKAVFENLFLDIQEGIPPTVKDGTISQRPVKTQDGSTAYQTNAAITQGNSGGPAVNERGEVIGVATFGSVGEKGIVHGYNFLRPSRLVEELLVENGVRTWDVMRAFKEIVFKARILMDSAYSIGEHKMKNCVNFQQHGSHAGFCAISWEWSKQAEKREIPVRYKFDGSRVRFRQDGEEIYMEPYRAYCAFCEHYKAKSVRVFESEDRTETGDKNIY